MLKTLSLHALRSLHVLVRTPGWSEVKEALNAELLETYKHMTAARDTAILHELRGRAKFITEFLQASETTQVVLEKLESSRTQ